MKRLHGRLPDGPDGRPWELVDLPGIHDLTAGSDDEAIVQRFLSQPPPDGVLVVLNASHFSSQLRLVLDLRQLKLPLLLAQPAGGPLAPAFPDEDAGGDHPVASPQFDDLPPALHPLPLHGGGADP